MTEDSDSAELMTWIIAGEIRGELEYFHGGGAVDPDDPARDEGFISDRQMKALNIVIRHAVHTALTRMRAMGEGDEQAARLVQLQLVQVPEYMEPPGSAELEKAYREVTGQGDTP
jgi:hypothetical protein